MAHYRVTPAASDDLDAIYTQGFHLFGETQAEHYHDELHRIFNLLTDYPRIARTREEIDGMVRAYPFKAHMIVYEMDDAENILILRVRHSREDWQRDPA